MGERKEKGEGREVEQNRLCNTGCVLKAHLSLPYTLELYSVELLLNNCVVNLIV